MNTYQPHRLSAGAVVVRCEAGTYLYLLLRAYRYWDFPKGIVEVTESAHAAAQREVREETGLHVRVGEYLGAETFISRRSRVTCAYYLAQCTRNAEPATEGRNLIWLPLADAIEKATFPAGRNTLEKARRALPSSARSVSE